jgi:hypothetical protein
MFMSSNAINLHSAMEEDGRGERYLDIGAPLSPFFLHSISAERFIDACDESKEPVRLSCHEEQGMTPGTRPNLCNAARQGSKASVQIPAKCLMT